jgi:hypothetical protein
MAKTGRPRIEFTPEQEAVVKALAENGVRQDRIAASIGVSESTLKNHFKEVLSVGNAKAMAAFEQSFYQRAMFGKSDSAAIFYAKSRLGYREDAPDPGKKKKRQITFRVTGPGERIETSSADDSNEED